MISDNSLKQIMPKLSDAGRAALLAPLQSAFNAWSRLASVASTALASVVIVIRGQAKRLLPFAEC
jgi:hypothetical protein